MVFTPSVVKVEKGLIGEIKSTYKMQLFKKTIQKGVFETISIGVEPYEIKRLSNGKFITNNSKSVTLFDENFKEEKKIHIEGPAFGCAIHNDKGIFITDHENGCIYLMDNELNIIKTFGSKGKGIDQLNGPTTIICQNDYLFVSDLFNRRIQILTLDLKYHDTIELDFHPCSVAASSKTIGMIELSRYPNKIYFYDLKTKKMKKVYQSIDGKICFIDSHFYVVNFNPTKKLLIFDEEGKFVDEARIESIGEHINSSWDGFMFSSKYNLFISSKSGGNVLKFKL